MSNCRTNVTASRSSKLRNTAVARIAAWYKVAKQQRLWEVDAGTTGTHAQQTTELNSAVKRHLQITATSKDIFGGRLVVVPNPNIAIDMKVIILLRSESQDTSIQQRKQHRRRSPAANSVNPRQ